jgi:hypothetical protein
MTKLEELEQEIEMLREMIIGLQARIMEIETQRDINGPSSVWPLNPDQGPQPT